LQLLHDLLLLLQERGHLLAVYVVRGADLLLLLWPQVDFFDAGCPQLLSWRCWLQSLKVEPATAK
jgi:hypothetical protein